jgi:hypothetical protein
MKRLRLSALLLVIVLFALSAALIVQERRIARLESEVLSPPPTPIWIETERSPFEMDTVSLQPRPSQNHAPGARVEKQTPQSSHPGAFPGGHPTLTDPPKGRQGSPSYSKKALEPPMLPSVVMPSASAPGSVPLEWRVRELDRQIEQLTRERDNLRRKLSGGEGASRPESPGG